MHSKRVCTLRSRTHTHTHAHTSGGLKKWLFDFGYRWKLKNMQAGWPVAKAAPLFDWLVFGKARPRGCGPAPLGEWTLTQWERNRP